MVFPFVDSIGRINFRILAETARTPGVPWASWSSSRARVEKVKEVEVEMEVEGRAPKERTNEREKTRVERDRTHGISTDRSLKARNDERRWFDSPSLRKCLGRDVGCPRNANIRHIAAGEVTEGRREGGLSLRNEVEESIRHASTSTPFAKQR
ncbi:hypothetical protein G5I_14010 [Acromyrmex echinatior]|uniref:Uncharacterized protein n=1 Tax=Acromyrmex echinatior TaxID=103372 RepID=F4X6P2_ACREC|nr:hypothetical protein G5I_14010 [Acromyrmex echinatior]